VRGVLTLLTRYRYHTQFQVGRTWYRQPFGNPAIPATKTLVGPIQNEVRS